MKTIWKLTKFDLKLSKKLLFGWSISLFGFMFLYMILFPSMEEMAQVKLDSLPTELTQFVGVSNFEDMGNYINYFSMVLNIILVAISVFAVTYGAKLISQEEKNKTIEFIYSLEISRVEIYLSKLFTAIIGVTIVLVSVVLAGFICGFIVGGDTFEVADFIIITKTSSITPYFFLSITCMLSGLSGKISSSMCGSMVVISSYLLGYLGNLLEDKAEWLFYLSPFQLFSSPNGTEITRKLIIEQSIYGTLLFLAFAIGLYTYKKRDFKI